jgi:hypothetical protein
MYVTTLLFVSVIVEAVDNNDNDSIRYNRFHVYRNRFLIKNENKKNNNDEEGKGGEEVGRVFIHIADTNAGPYYDYK